MGTREELAFLATVAEQAGRYEDMTVYMKRIAEMGMALTVDERNNLSLAYKNNIGSKRQAWRAIYSYEARDPDPCVPQYRVQVEGELQAGCTEAINLISNHLLKLPNDIEAQVFYTKMCGDYYRYLAEFSQGDEHAQAVCGAEQQYTRAVELANGLPASDPIRLGLALNFAVFYFEVLRQTAKAVQLAKDTLESVNSATLSEDSQQIIPLLQENLKLWVESHGQDGTAVEEM